MKRPSQTEQGFNIKARQLSGQPAGPGFAMGDARIVETREQLYDLRAGEVLICDSVDPNMTFVLPIVAAIIECRGGMLIHGAIIAREYGIPCVTGVTQALSALKTGDKLKVDGFIGLVTVGE